MLPHAPDRHAGDLVCHAGVEAHEFDVRLEIRERHRIGRRVHLAARGEHRAGRAAYHHRLIARTRARLPSSTSSDSRTLPAPSSERHPSPMRSPLKTALLLLVLIPRLAAVAVKADGRLAERARLSDRYRHTALIRRGSCGPAARAPLAGDSDLVFPRTVTWSFVSFLAIGPRAPEAGAKPARLRTCRRAAISAPRTIDGRR